MGVFANSRCAADDDAGCAIADNEVHVWRIVLARDAAATRKLAGLLSLDETARADRLHRPLHRNRWIVARAALRITLARYAGCAPDAVRLETDAQGKPWLAPAGQAPLFNLSHSGGVALLAVTPSGRVGIDIELIRSNVGHRALAQRLFTPDEVAALDACAPVDRQKVFFMYWARKEAVLKAVGTGLAFPLNKLQVNAGVPACIEHFCGERADDWTLFDLSEAGFAAALAIDRPYVTVQRFEFK